MSEYATKEEVDRYVKARDDINETLAVSVKIDWREAAKLVAADLISKRNACRDPVTVAAFDKVLLEYYLTKDEHHAATNHVGE